VLVDDQERERICTAELAVGHGVADIPGGVDASAELCALGRCAAEADASNLFCELGAVEDDDGLRDVIALLVLPVHVILGLVADTRDFTELEVELVDDGLDELRQVSDKARGEGMLEDAEALALEFRVAQRAALVVNLGVYDGADGHDGVVAVVLLEVVDEDDGLGVVVLYGLVFVFQAVDGVFERGHFSVAWAVELHVVLRIVV